MTRSRLPLLALCLAAFSAPADNQSIDWLGDYRAALRQAKATGKPLLVEFRCEA